MRVEMSGDIGGGGCFTYIIPIKILLILLTTCAGVTNRFNLMRRYIVMQYVIEQCSPNKQQTSKMNQLIISRSWKSTCAIYKALALLWTMRLNELLPIGYCSRGFESYCWPYLSHKLEVQFAKSEVEWYFSNFQQTLLVER